jgi:Methyltransferase domain
MIGKRLFLPVTRFRRRRMAKFLETFQPMPSTRILDVGGTDVNWRLIGFPGELVLLNLRVPAELNGLPPNVRYVQGDGTALGFPDRSFDIGFSNSVIEHLENFERQRLFADELRRVGRDLWVQTPARWFPIEPHHLAPLIHFLPKRWQRRLVRNFTPYGWVVRPTQEHVDSLITEYRLVTYREMRALFPDCEIRRERVLGLTKSYIAIRRSGERLESA